MAIAVAALYALLLQAFLLGALPLGMPAGLHDRSALCASMDGSGGRDEAPSHHADGACCLAATAFQPLLPPTVMIAGVSPPRVDGIAVGRTPRDSALPRAPPRRAHAARGPPQA